jgi:hypothetical protein
MTNIIPFKKRVPDYLDEDGNEGFSLLECWLMDTVDFFNKFDGVANDMLEDGVA